MLNVFRVCADWLFVPWAVRFTGGATARAESVFLGNCVWVETKVLHRSSSRSVHIRPSVLSVWYTCYCFVCVCTVPLGTSTTLYCFRVTGALLPACDQDSSVVECHACVRRDYSQRVPMSILNRRLVRTRKHQSWACARSII